MLPTESEPVFPALLLQRWWPSASRLTMKMSSPPALVSAPPPKLMLPDIVPAAYTFPSSSTPRKRASSELGPPYRLLQMCLPLESSLAR